MNSKQLSVFILGIMLVGFLYLMKHPNTKNKTVIQSINNKTVGFEIIDTNNKNSFDPSTQKPQIENILDIPAWSFNLDTLAKLTSEELVHSIEKSIQDKRYFQPEDDNALFYLASLKSIDKDNSNIEIFSQELEKYLEISTHQALENNDEKLLILNISRIKSLDSSYIEIEKLESQLANIQTLNTLYSQGTNFIQNELIVTDDSKDAWHITKQMIEIDAGNEKTRELLTEVTNILVNNALRAAEETDFQLAQDQIKQAHLLDSSSDTVNFVQAQINQLKQQRYLWLEDQLDSALKQINVSRAQRMLQQLAELDLPSSQINEYQNEIDRITIFGKYRPFEIFSDKILNNIELPKMVVMPRGSFLMGSDDGPKHEKPTHQVNIDYGFAISQNEISIQDFTYFIENSDYETDADLNESSRIYDIKLGRLKNKSYINWQKNYIGKKSKSEEPVIHVSWNDAVAYTQWLSQQTGKKYRLLNESEFEYVLRAGSTSTYPWGDNDPLQVIENLTGNLDKSRDNPKFRWVEGFDNYNDKYWGPAPVGSFISNPFRLNDTAGNVMEWVMDCWHDSYTRAPTNGISWTNPGCQDHVIRGGSWSSSKGEFTSSHRFKANANFTDARLGFRIALDLK